MMAKYHRKTVDVEALRLRINAILALTADDMDRERDALGHLLSTTLMDTGNYVGFSYIDRDGSRVSVERILSGEYDSTRVVYHKKGA